MAVMMRIHGMERLRARLAKMHAEAVKNRKATVIVGYTQAYAVYVHENLEAHHPHGEAKFLEKPARDKRHEIVRAVEQAYQRTRDFARSLLVGGLLLQRESQKLVPVDTGALRASAVTRKEK